MQQAGVNNGALSSSQNLAMGDSAIASQNTAIVGDSGSIDSSALSQGNQAETVNGYFIGGGYLDSQLASMSGQGSGMQGTASINGMEVVNSGILQELESGEVEMEIDGLSYYDLIRLGYFSVSATNKVSDISASTKLAPALPTVQGQGIITKDGSNPEIVDSPLGNANSYRLNMGKINQAKPIQLFLRKDSYLTNEGLDSSAGAQAISRAANTWDYWTKPSQNNLFQPAVIVDSSKKVDTHDGYSVNAFTPISNSQLAYARTWYSGKYLSEVDVCYNTNYQWTTDWDKAQSSNKAVIDLQTVALHELGHGIGLHDLYNLPQGDIRRNDHYAIMNNYDAPQHNLGAGDIAAIRAIYRK